MLRYLLIFLAVVLLASTLAAFHGGLGFYLAEEFTPDQIQFRAPQ